MNKSRVKISPRRDGFTGKHRFWFVIALVLVLIASGSAAGIILSAQIDGSVEVKVKTPVHLGKPWVTLLQGEDVFTSIDVEGMSFRVIAEAEPGDAFLIHLPVLNDSTADVSVILNAAFPGKVMLSASGSGVIQDVVAASYSAWKFTADAQARGANVGPYDGLQIQVSVPAGYSGLSVEISGTLQIITGNSGSFIVPSYYAPEGDILFLHNNPSPPLGDTNAQADLLMDGYYPTAASLHNYDMDMNDALGRTILAGGSDNTETSLDRYQNWQTIVTDDLTLDGNVTLVLWSAKRLFSGGPGSITAYLSDLSSPDLIEIGSGVLALDQWKGESESWVERRITVPVDNYVVRAGHKLELKLIVDSNFSDMWLAYDTVTYPSRLILDTPPVAGYSAQFVSSTGSATTVSFTDLSLSEDGIVSWEWDFGDGGTSDVPNPVHVFAANNNYKVTLTVSESDGDSNTIARKYQVTAGAITQINTTPAADFSASPRTGFGPLKVKFTDASTSDEGIVSRLWNFGDGGASTEQNPTHIYTSSGGFDVTLIVTEVDGDRDTESRYSYIVTTPDIAVADFSASPTSGYAPLTVTFTDHSTSAVGITQWSWDFGDGGTSTLQNPSHTYTSAGTYTVSLAVVDSSGSSDGEARIAYISTTQSVPVANFAGSPASGYKPLTVSFADLSTSQVGITSWYWDFGDGGISTLQNPSHTYTSTGTFSVSLTVTDAGNGSDTITRTNYITVPQTVPLANFSGSPTSGYRPKTISFTDLSTSQVSVVSWSWDFGDGGTSTLQNPSHTYTTSGTFTVSLTAFDSSGNSDNETKTGYITVSESVPVANFTGSPTSGYGPLIVAFSDQSTSPVGISSWLWNFGDGGTSTQQSPIHTYTSPGIFTVSLTVVDSSGNSDSEVRTGHITVQNRFYLHNFPTPPVGNTTMQTNLSMNASAPTTTVLYNYDTDHDTDWGRLIDRGGSGPTENDVNRYMNWRTTVSQNTTINGDVTAMLWTGMKNFNGAKAGVVTVYLRDYYGGGYTEIGNATLSLDPWQQSSPGWNERQITIPGVNYTVLAGHTLELKIVVPSSSGDGLWFAYDVTGYPSRLLLP